MADGNNVNPPAPPAQEQSHDITGKNWDEVVGILKAIVNREDYKENAVFTIEISPANPRHPEKIFRLTAKPTENQPGNGFLEIRLMGRVFSGRAYHKQMVKDLADSYEGDTSALAEDLQTLFQNNKTIDEYPFVTSEVYMLLLFERGRRLVTNSAESTQLKKRFDALPIRKAIQGILGLLGKKKCQFDEVFLKEGKFHCFSNRVDIREKKVEEIEKALLTESEIDGSLSRQFNERLNLNE